MRPGCYSLCMSKAQLDLFSEAPRGGGATAIQQEPPPADFIARIRGELNATLSMARDAASLPWKDLTQTTLAELRFNSIANWLPAEEADALRAAFDAEMTRLYDIEDRLADEQAGAAQ